MVIRTSNFATRDSALANRFDYANTLRALLKPYLSDGYPDATLAALLMDTSVRG